jgi:hypothetical protein
VSIASGAAQQRLVLMARLIACDSSVGDPLDVATSPTRMALGTDDLEYLRGAVVGNLLLVAAFAAACAALAAVAALRCGDRMRYAMGSVRLPGVVVVVMVPLLQPTVSCVVELYRFGDGPSATGAASVALSLLAGTALHVVWMTTVRFGATPRQRLTELHRAGPATRWPRRAAAWLLDERCEWEDARDRPRFTREYGCAFASYVGGRHWYFGVELLTEASCGAISGTIATRHAGVGGRSCLPQSVALCCVSATALCLLLLLRPSNTRFDLITSAANLVVIAACASLKAAGLDAWSAAVAWVGFAVVCASLATFVASLVLSGGMRRMLASLRRSAAVLVAGRRAKRMAPREAIRGGPPTGWAAPLIISALEAPGCAVVISDTERVRRLELLVRVIISERNACPAAPSRHL